MSRLSQDQQKLIDSVVNSASNAVRLDAVNNKKHLKNPEFVKEYLKKHGRDLKYVAEKLKDDEGVVLTAVLQDGLALKYASQALKNDEDVVIPAINQNPYALQYASKALKKDIDVVLPALQGSGLVLRYASPRIQNNPDAVMTAIMQSPAALQYASPHLRGEGWDNDSDVRSIVWTAATYGRENILPFVQGEAAGRIATDYVRRLPNTGTGHHSHDTLWQQCVLREHQYSLDQKLSALQTKRFGLERQLQDTDTQIKKLVEESKKCAELADALNAPSIDDTPAAPHSQQS